jgi:hypothetical protein
MRSVIRHLAAGALAVIVFPAVCFAQFGTIAGVVKDSSGAVLPGVTVEAASPALIEKTRAAVSDSAGQYSVPQLRPGVYTVTFTLTGFSTVRRDGIEISAGFVAPVNASMKVGAVSETITVQGQAPVVDVQSSAERKQLAKEALDALPTARSFATVGTTLPGVTANQRDVGGTQGERGNVLAAHGGSGFDMTVQLDGVAVGNMGSFSGSAWSNFSLNDAAAQEMVFETGAVSVEAASGGVRVNVVPREGGNRFSGSAFGNFSKRSMERNNLTADLQARNPLLRSPGFDSLVDESGAFGGPLRRDRLWFFVAHRYRSNDLTGSNQFFSKDPLAYVYNPDFTRPLNAGGFDMDNQARVTAQVSPRNKLSGFYDKINKCNCPTIADAATQTGESGTRLTYPPSYLASISWQSTISSKLLFDGALSYNRQPTDNSPQPEANITFATASVLELSTLRRLRAPFHGGSEGNSDQGQRNGRAALSYVTGSHSAKVGMTWHDGWITGGTYPFSSNLGLQLLNGVSSSVVLRTDPYTTRTNLNADMGIYAQDRWTVRRMTLSGGVRFDYFNTSIPAQSADATRFVAARSFAAIENVPNWKDISPRVGVAYDLFGTGKTALKASVSRYVTGFVFAFTGPINPLSNSVNSATRGWNDGANGNPKDFIPQGDPLNPLPNGEFTGTINPLFGTPLVTTRYDPAVSEGWGKRPYNWEYSVSVQHELLPRVSVDAGYYRRVFGNFTVTDNLDITPADFTSFCITAPTDARLGSVSGSQVCGLADISAAKAGVAGTPSNQIIRFSSEYAGERSQVYDGVDFTVNARPTGRLFVQAGISTGRTVTKTCSVVDSPQTLRFCEVAEPFLPNYRVSGGYTFPWQLQISGVFQSIAPVTGTVASLPVNNATPGNTLGRPIATAGGVINAPLINPAENSNFADRVNQLDLRLTKGFRVGRYRLDALVDYYNAFNVSPVQTYTTTYSAANWLAPTGILQSAYVKLGGRFVF